MIRTKNSILNALSAVVLSLINGLLGFVLTRSVLTVFGSDFNGVNSTANQLVNMLSIVEGGFTTATNVALFKPWNGGDSALINGILSATRKKFFGIGSIFLAAGLVSCAAYSFIARTSIARLDIFLILIMAVVPLAVNFLFAVKYRILIQAEQREYVISVIGIISVGAGYLANILIVRYAAPVLLAAGHTRSYVLVRATTMLFSLLQSLYIVIYSRRRYKTVDLRAEPDFSAIKGTRDVLAQKITGVIYSSAPMLLITAFSARGAAQASVYSVYNYVFAMISMLMHAVIDAVRLPIGSLAAERGVGKIKSRFMQYELVVYSALCAMIATAGAMIMPFVRIYSAGVDDIDYSDPFIAVGLAAAAFLDLAHIPATNLIVMSGDFRTSRRIQLAGSAVLLALSAALCPFFDVYGIVVAVAVSAGVLCFLDLFVVHKRYYGGEAPFLKNNLPLVLLCPVLAFAEARFLPSPGGYPGFFALTAAAGIFNCAAVIALDMIFNRKDTLAVIRAAVKTVFPGRPGHPG
ncbi:MAG: polysaccharide biosynthesis C-terminal domain-containing protein [Clostridia bacterium]|nr:polysaccharide biosynthesis C-terminal domain-containing protein [Clostridia bacterium]